MNRSLTSTIAVAVLGCLIAINAARSEGVCEEKSPDWKPGPANNLETCRGLWDGIGTPEYAADVDATPVCHTAYALSHNNVRKTPDWVLEHLTRAQAKGTNTRPSEKFKPEANVCPAAQALDREYAGSKLDRGHQAPSNDFKSSLDLMVESFILSNVVPQVGIGFNRGIWKEFEALVRNLAINRGEIYVITGPIYPDENGKIPPIKADTNSCRKEIKFELPKKTAICDANDKDPKKECENGVAVPVGLFKIIYDPGMKRANAYVMPNIDHRDLETENDPLEYLKRYRTSLKVVERYTGLKFLDALPSRIRKTQVESCPASMLH